MAGSNSEDVDTQCTKQHSTIYSKRRGADNDGRARDSRSWKVIRRTRFERFPASNRPMTPVANIQGIKKNTTTQEKKYSTEPASKERTDAIQKRNDDGESLVSSLDSRNDELPF